MSATLKDKKNLTRLYDGKLTFKTIVIKLYKQPKEQKKHLRLFISSIRVVVVAETDDEIFALSTIKIYSYFSFDFSAMPKKVELLKISKVM